MKRRTFLALGLTAALSIPFAMTAFADGNQYKVGQTVEFSGRTDFDYFYTYTAEDYSVYPFPETDYKCFSVIDESGKRFYAAVKSVQYEHARTAFANQTFTFKGKYQQTAGDGAPIILISQKITFNEKNQKIETSIGKCMWDVTDCGTTSDSVFRTLHDVYADITITLADDGSYLSIDTNPYDLKDNTTNKAIGLMHVREANESLGLPDWLYEEIVSTRAIDGRQKETFDKVTVTWSYHPDHGLEVIYRKN